VLLLYCLKKKEKEKVAWLSARKRRGEKIVFRVNREKSTARVSRKYATLKKKGKEERERQLFLLL
jgi:hypothetical protein